MKSLLERLNDIRKNDKAPNPAVIVHPDDAAEMRQLLGLGRKLKAPQTPAQMVYDAPADYNRATRRAFGLLSKLWRWDIPADGTVLPRYIRRHVRYSLQPGLRARRQRKVRARIGRIIAAKGLS